MPATNASGAGDGPLSQAGSAKRSERYAVIRRVTLIGSGLDLALGIAKIAGGLWAHSQSLVADGVHSLSDLATDVAVLVAAKHASAGADEDHPYGHARIETAATAGLGVALMLVAVGIGYDAARNLFEPQSLVAPHPVAILIAAISVLSKEAVYQYTMVHARALRSGLLRANAWHSRSDAASSLVVIVGVGGALLGLDYLDGIAAIVVAWMVGHMGFRFAQRGMEELVDKGLDAEELRSIRRIIMSVDGVADLHLLRTRQMAGSAFVDVHIILDDPRVSVSEGHQISEMVRACLMRQVPEVEDVTVHIDPEDDEKVAPGRYLPLRSGLMERLREAWSDVDAAADVEHVVLHYLNGRVDVDVELPVSVLDKAQAADLSTAFRRASARVDGLGEVRLRFLDSNLADTTH